ncbi:MAG: hypothetical protein CME62_05140 [Halobacteriovoraceae bacterium]|nr:hypothetical protein [Halobacteriovoraceae bacterium]|tara:strand:- start:4018 stop:4830 length:813 start_codon:yes stop_codon:yes gene_type:complete
MDLAYSSYQLTSRSLPNVLSRPEDKVYDGVLLRVDKKYFLDYFPWQVFGDCPCEEFLLHLKEQGLPDYLKNLLELEKNRDVIDHQSFNNHGFNQVADITKVKVFSLDELNITLEKYNGRVRLDFNNAYPDQDVMKWWLGLSEEDRQKIDYIEDPCTPEFYASLKLKGMPIASDRVQYDSEIKIFKPNIESIQKGKKLIFSSYMGHDLGRYHAYLSLLTYGDRELVHGINTPGVYLEQKPLFIQNNLSCSIDKQVRDEMYKELGEREWISL